jgi:hypothetical protein
MGKLTSQLVRQHATHGSIKGTLDDTIHLRDWMRNLIFLSTRGEAVSISISKFLA